MEVVLVTVIFALFALGLYRVMTLGCTAWSSNEERVDAQQNVRIAISHLSRELRMASSFEVLNSGSAVLMTFPGGETVKYYLNGQQLLRDVNGAGHNVVAYGINEVALSKIADGHEIDILIEGESGYCLSTRVFLRVPGDDISEGTQREGMAT